MPDPSPTASEADAPSRSCPPEGASSLGSLVGPLALVVLAGVWMPPHFGLLLPLTLGLAFAVLGERRARFVANARAVIEDGRGTPAARLSLLVLALVAAAILLTVIARGVGSLLVEQPAALWGAGAALGVAAVWSVLGPRLSVRARPVALFVLALAIPWAGVHGSEHEAAGSDAHGWAHSGPILGIHPFQMTAVIIDGEGPFDLPINDYVEPDGGRGYGPLALADALDRALVSIADRVYPDGPARIRRALIDAEVVPVVTDAVWEQLDRPPIDRKQPRFIVRSGSFGDGSRVEFVCPGRRIDPRGPQGESVMNRMCPDKYASEASAGLGVTGRWSGYSEGRGNAREGLFRAWGWTRGSDAEGRKVVERETRAWAWIVLALLVLLRWRPLRVAGEGLAGLGGALGLLGVAALVVLAVGSGSTLAVGAWPVEPTWRTWTDLGLWTPALALAGLALFSLDGPRRVEAPTPAASGRARRWLATPSGPSSIVAPAAIVVLVATLAVAASLPALSWSSPLHGSQGASWLAFSRGLAEAIGERGGLTIFEVEGAVASVLVAILMGAAAATVRAAHTAVLRLAPWPAPNRWVVLGAVVTTVAVAAAMVVSRKTSGAAALMPGVIGMTLVLGSGLLQISASERRGRGLLTHVLWTGLGCLLVRASISPLPDDDVVATYAVLGLAVVVLPLVPLLLRALSGPDSTPLERDASARL